MVRHTPLPRRLYRDRRPHARLLIVSGLLADNSVVALNTATMEELNLFRGDTVILKGKRRKETVCIVLADDTCEAAKVRLNRGERLRPWDCASRVRLCAENSSNSPLTQLCATTCASASATLCTFHLMPGVPRGRRRRHRHRRSCSPPLLLLRAPSALTRRPR
jgi:hypothetical protein